MEYSKYIVLLGLLALALVGALFNTISSKGGFRAGLKEMLHSLFFGIGIAYIIWNNDWADWARKVVVFLCSAFTNPIVTTIKKLLPSWVKQIFNIITNTKLPKDNDQPDKGDNI